MRSCVVCGKTQAIVPKKSRLHARRLKACASSGNRKCGVVGNRGKGAGMLALLVAAGCFHRTSYEGIARRRSNWTRPSPEGLHATWHHRVRVEATTLHPLKITKTAPMAKSRKLFNLLRIVPMPQQEQASRGASCSAKENRLNLPADRGKQTGRRHLLRKVFADYEARR